MPTKAICIFPALSVEEVLSLEESICFPFPREEAVGPSNGQPQWCFTKYASESFLRGGNLTKLLAPSR